MDITELQKIFEDQRKAAEILYVTVLLKADVNFIGNQFLMHIRFPILNGN